MIDKIYYKSNKEVIIYFTNKKQFTLYSSNGQVIDLLDELMVPVNSNCTTLSEWEHRVKISKEDTQEIHLNKVA